MYRKRYSPEQIIPKLREAEVKVGGWQYESGIGMKVEAGHSGVLHVSCLLLLPEEIYDGPPP